MLARIESVCGPLSPELLAHGRASHHFYTRSQQLYERDAASGGLSVLQPTPTPLSSLLPAWVDAPFVDFLEQLLQTDPAQRPTAEAALAHPWLAA